jgi:hypothetical protein
LSKLNTTKITLKFEKILEGEHHAIVQMEILKGRTVEQSGNGKRGYGSHLENLDCPRKLCKHYHQGNGKGRLAVAGKLYLDK